MTQEDLWRNVAKECPRKIIADLHEDGLYRHGTSARYPHKVLCLHWETPPPEGWVPTDAQATAENHLHENLASLN